jgi:hypothetical protein
MSKKMVEPLLAPAVRQVTMALLAVSVKTAVAAVPADCPPPVTFTVKVAAASAGAAGITATAAEPARAMADALNLLIFLTAVRSFTEDGDTTVTDSHAPLR